MHDTAIKIQQLAENFDEKQQKRFKVKTFVNLCNKLPEQADPNIKKLVEETYLLLEELNKDRTIKPKVYLKSFGQLQKRVRSELGLVEEGALRSEFMALGIAIGVALGASFVALNPAFIAIGLPIGLAIGLAIGEQKEKQAAEEGKTY